MAFAEIGFSGILILRPCWDMGCCGGAGDGRGSGGGEGAFFGSSGYAPGNIGRLGIPMELLWLGEVFITVVVVLIVVIVVVFILPSLEGYCGGFGGGVGGSGGGGGGGVCAGGSRFSIGEVWISTGAGSERGGGVLERGVRGGASAGFSTGGRAAGCVYGGGGALRCGCGGGVCGCREGFGCW